MIEKPLELGIDTRIVDRGKLHALPQSIPGVVLFCQLCGRFGLKLALHLQGEFGVTLALQLQRKFGLKLTLLLECKFGLTLTLLRQQQLGLALILQGGGKFGFMVCDPVINAVAGGRHVTGRWGIGR